MSVLIKGMEMPSCCGNCVFGINVFENAYMCFFEGAKKPEIAKTDMPDWCPLEEVDYEAN